jgi:hypothetical protein
MAKQILEKITLDDGHQMRIYDTSQKISGDRWTVSLLVEIDIFVVNSLFKQGKILTEELNKIKEVIGEAVVFKKTTERFFVDQALKRQVLDQLIADFKQNILGYLNHPDFARRFVLKTYSEKKP